ncbi:MAG: UvrB/UvrC motif-containing protein, partial [Flavobacteriales bacterium]|nr:UvrB/UvrC motif-containing protein [Flavobacteriales bacterium]
MREIVKGRVTGVIRLLKERMQVHAEQLEFEEAAELKEKIARLEHYRAKSIVVNPDIGDVDIFGLAGDTGSTYVNYMRVIDGAVVHGITIELKRRIATSDAEVLQLAIAELRQRYHSTA